MAQQKDRQQRRRGGPATGPIRKKNCWFCRMKIDEVDWKDANQLRRYVSEKGKIRSRRITGACRRHQRQVAVAVKRAREMALLPYVAEGRDDREGGRRDRGDRDRDRDR
jgi:small subunit ribosomal protein S18